jgi:hypothetical protein
LFPSELQTITGLEVPGCCAVSLKGLAVEDAISLWRRMGVSGDDRTLGALFDTFERYPLLIRALAGEVARFRPAPGDFDRWRVMNPGFNPYKLPLVQVRSHVLAFALQGLNPEARQLLNTIAAFRAPTDYQTVAAIFAQQVPKGSAIQLDEVLTELEDRGLVGWDKRFNTYDLHPVVRGVVWESLDVTAQSNVYEAVLSHFQSVPNPVAERQYVSESKPAIEQFGSLVGLKRFDAAVDFFVGRMMRQIDFEISSALGLKKQLVEAVLSSFDFAPGNDTHSAFLLESAGTYFAMGNMYDACRWFWRAYSNTRYSGDLHHAKLGIVRSAIEAGYLKFGMELSGHWLIGQEDDRARIPFALCLAMVGKYGEAREHLSWKEGENIDTIWSLARAAVLLGDPAFLVEFEDLVRKQAPKESDGGWVCELLRQERLLLSDEVDVRTEPLEAALFRAKRAGRLGWELSIRCLLAKIYRLTNRRHQAREVLEDLEDIGALGALKLLLADLYNVLADVELDDGNRDGAVLAARGAYTIAWCDGPEYSYARALDRSRHALETLCAECPNPSPRDAKFEGLIFNVPGVRGR